MQPRIVPLLGILLVSWLALSGNGNSVENSAAASRPESVLLERDAEFVRVTAEKGMDGFLSFIAEDAAFFPAGGSISMGHEAARAIWAEILTTPGVSLRWKPVRAELGRSGELGYTYGTYVFRKSEPGKEDVTSYGKYVTIWRKEAGGWKVAADIGTPSPAPATE